MTFITFLIAVFLSATTWTTGQGSTGYTDKYPHEGSGYLFINVDDGCSGDLAVGSDFSIPIGTSKYHHLYASTNGAIPLESCTISHNYIAPYLTDLYPEENVGTFSYRVFFNRHDSIDISILNRTERDIRYFYGTSITATWALVATWNNVGFYTARSQHVTVQCVLITDGVSTYAIFNYLDVNVPGTFRQSVSFGWYGDNGNLLLDNSFTTKAFQMSLFDGNQGVPGFWFFKLAPDINECDFQICKNGGSCHNTNGSYYCECTKYWNGTNCADDINECETDNCQNGGSCHNTIGSYYCECTKYWNGTDCMDDINECETDICQNGGSCHNTNGSYNCECTEQWNGTNCMDDINECESSPCMNDMQCVNTNGSFFCNCSKDYGGRFCENSLRSQFYCNTGESSVIYCIYGCCGHGRCQHCCKNEIAIGYITASVVAVAMVITGGVVTFVIKRRLTKTNREREFRTIETQTEIKIHPATEWKTTSDPRRGKLYAVNGHITPPPSGVIDRIVEMRKSRARTSKERKDKDDPESRMSVTKPVHDTIERPISRFDSLSSIKTNDEVVELDVF